MKDDGLGAVDDARQLRGTRDGGHGVASAAPVGGPGRLDLLPLVLRVGVLVLLLASCAPSPSPTPEPEPTESGRTAAEMAAVLAESIEIVYGSDPQPAWYSEYIELTVEDDWAYIRTALTDAAVAESACRDIAAVTFDDNAEPIGVTDVLIFGVGGEDLADCDVVTR